MKNKVGLIGVVNNPVLSDNSHNGGWTKTLISILENNLGLSVDVLKDEEEWNNYETLYLTEGVNYKENVFNFFGGVQDKQISRLKKFSEYKGNVISLSGLVDYNVVMNKRKELANYNFKFKVPKTLDIINTSKDLILGDSHSISAFKDGQTISRNDGKTLRGFLNNGISNYIPKHIEKLTFYAGNIDVRFHMFNPKRPTNYRSLIEDLISRLESQLLDLNLKTIRLVELLPIEDESRKLPKTGQLDGLNFYGTKDQRSEAVIYFNKKLEYMCLKNGFEYLRWDLGSTLCFSDMEAKQSVHLRPSSYMFNKKTTLF